MARNILRFPLRLGLRRITSTVVRNVSIFGTGESSDGKPFAQELSECVRLYNRPEYGSIPYKQLQVPFDTFSIADVGDHHANFLKFDLQSVNIDDIESSNVFEISLKTDIQNMNPDVIYMQHVQELTYKLNIQKALRQLGYDGYFTKTYEDRGMATFFKTDMLRGSPLRS